MSFFKKETDLPELTGLDSSEQKRLYKQVAKDAQKALGAKLIPFYLIPVAAFVASLVLKDSLPFIVRAVIIAGAMGIMWFASRPMLISKMRELLRAQGYPK